MQAPAADLRADPLQGMRATSTASGTTDSTRTDRHADPTRSYFIANPNRSQGGHDTMTAIDSPVLCPDNFDADRLNRSGGLDRQALVGDENVDAGHLRVLEYGATAELGVIGK